MEILLGIAILRDNIPLHMEYLQDHEYNNANIADLPDRAKNIARILEMGWEDILLLRKRVESVLF